MGGVKRGQPPKPVLVEPYELQGWPEAHGMDRWLDLLETDLRAISHRRMTHDQLDRFTRLIHGAEAEAVTRGRAA